MTGSTLTALSANLSVVRLLSSVFYRPSSFAYHPIIRSSSFRDYFLLKNTFHRIHSHAALPF